MKPRALIFDVYGTLLQLGPPPANVDILWEDLLANFYPHPPKLSWLDFSRACSKAISLRQNAAKRCGIPFPEIVWPSVVLEILPEFGELSASLQEEFVFRQSQLTHSAVLDPGAASLLPRLKTGRYQLGIASNAQAYTLRELEEACAAEGLPWHSYFELDLCFWSFQHGFSKPDPHVFRILTARLEARGVSAPEALMIGDRLDNDIEPARAQDWQTWWLTPAPGVHVGGSWFNLASLLAAGHHQ